MNPKHSLEENQTNLKKVLHRRISALGPLTIAQFMTIALTDPQYGYYSNKEPFGVEGDFITSPEISQMFGELIGAWLANNWATNGFPNPARLVELGPGRGTLMFDAIRAARLQDNFISSVTLHLIEISKRLRKIQHKKLANCGPSINWHKYFSDVPEGPVFAIANEFFDAMPIRQFENTDKGWCERLIHITKNGDLRFVLSRNESLVDHLLPQEVLDSSIGSVAEISPSSVSLAIEISTRIVKFGGTLLIIDYGYNKFEALETFQSLISHKNNFPLQFPGKADLTAHVNFAMLGRAATNVGAKVFGPIPQGIFLENLGINQRADVLRAKAEKKVATQITKAQERLVSSKSMGSLFKVLCITSPDITSVAGFN